MAETNLTRAPAFKDFMQSSKASVNLLPHLRENAKLSIVMGNESCDLDSAACSIAYALLLESEKAPGDIVLPVFNIMKNDITIKTEVIYFLEKFHVAPDLLIFRPDISSQLNKLAGTGQLNVTLVDHHFDKELNKYVVEIIDHRPKEYEFPERALVTVEPVGSCSSLVMQKIFNRYSESFPNKFPEAVEMLYGAILLDTNNMSTVSQRYNHIDFDIVTRIEPLVLKTAQRSEENKSRNEYFNELMAIRTDISLLSPLQMLSKDSKKAYSIPVCGLTMLVEAYCTLNGVEDALKAYCVANETSELILMGLSIQGETVARDMGFYSNSSKEKPIQLAEFIIKNAEPCIQLEKLTDLNQSVQGLTIFKQNNLKMTRKHILPVIKLSVSKLYNVHTLE